MTPERRERVWDLFDRAAALPPDERAAFLDGACGGDAEIRAEVESLLAHDVESTTEHGGGNILRSPLVRGRRNPDRTSPEFPSVEAPTLPERVGRNRILRLLG